MKFQNVLCWHPLGSSPSLGGERDDPDLLPMSLSLGFMPRHGPKAVLGQSWQATRCPFPRVLNLASCLPLCPSAPLNLQRWALLGSLFSCDDPGSIPAACYLGFPLPLCACVPWWVCIGAFIINPNITDECWEPWCLVRAPM